MTTEQQNLAWASLPKEVRDKIKERYSGWNRSICFETEEILYDDLFGIHNLTSDTEPEEMLMVERREVQKWYSSLSKEHAIYAKGTVDRISLGARIAMLEELFTKDKCLPNTPDSSNPANSGKEEQAKPKFSKGQKVIVKDVDKVLTIDTLFYNSRYNYWYANFEEADGSFVRKESDLEPYTEEISTLKFKKGDKVEHMDIPGIFEVVSHKEKFSNIFYELSKDGTDNFFTDESVLRLYTEEKNDMEVIDDSRFGSEADKEKELNLCELLKDRVGALFYSPYLGMCRLNDIDKDSDHPIELKNDNDEWVILPPSGHEPDGSVMLYPSRALYEKYPLEPAKAWQIWSEERKPKRWRAEDGEDYWWMNPFDFQVHRGREEYDRVDDRRYRAGLYFRTESDAKEAAEEVRKTLEAFHQRKEGEK